LPHLSTPNSNNCRYDPESAKDHAANRSNRRGRHERVSSAKRCPWSHRLPGGGEPVASTVEHNAEWTPKLTSFPVVPSARIADIALVQTAGTQAHHHENRGRFSALLESVVALCCCARIYRVRCSHVPRWVVADPVMLFTSKAVTSAVRIILDGSSRLRVDAGQTGPTSAGPYAHLSAGGTSNNWFAMRSSPSCCKL
jgi:hypothetical protein